MIIFGYLKLNSFLFFMVCRREKVIKTLLCFDIYEVEVETFAER